MSQPIFGVKSLKEFKKIGFIVPSSNVALEIITSSILTQLPLVSVHYSRIPVVTVDIDSGAATQFSSEKLVEVAKLIANCPVQCVVWNGTSESWTGEGYAAGVRIQRDIEAATGVQSTTTSLATVEALQLLGCKNIALATPYTQGNNERLTEYFMSCGFKVVKDSRLDITVNNDIADTSVERMEELIREADHPDAECIVVPCTNFPAALVVEKLEVELGKPIIDSIIVTLWKSLRIIGVDTPIHGWGKLLRMDSVLEELDQVMLRLRNQTDASRTTLRLDCFEHNCNVDRVCAESLAPEISSLRPNTSLNQRSLDTCQHIMKTGSALIQPDTINAAIQPPKALMTLYGVKAQMLIPLLKDDVAMAWISVHYVPSTREWTESDVKVLHDAAREVCTILRRHAWVDLMIR